MTTGTVWILNVPLVCPGAIVTDVGLTVTPAATMVIVIELPGDGLARVTVPVELEPPKTVLGERETVWTMGAFTETIALTLVEFSEAVTVTPAHSNPWDFWIDEY